MRLTKRRRTTRPDMNMTPMIDIVLLLIIFFMTVSQVSEIKQERETQLAKQKGSQEQTPTRLTINIMQDGELRVAGETVSFVALVSMVDQELARIGDPRLLTVDLRSDERGTSRMTNEVMRGLKQLGIRRIYMAVEAPE